MQKLGTPALNHAVLVEWKGNREWRRKGRTKSPAQEVGLVRGS